jgi:hypothetical protein
LALAQALTFQLHKQDLQQPGLAIQMLAWNATGATRLGKGKGTRSIHGGKDMEDAPAVEPEVCTRMAGCVPDS